MLQRTFGYYGGRWACLLSALGTVLEEQRGTRITEEEADKIVGKIHRTRSILIANYHNSKAPYIRDGYTNEWSGFNDEAWHFFFHKPDSMRLALHDIFDALNERKELYEAYAVIEVATQFSVKTDGVWSGTHFVLELGDGSIVNPDPTLRIIGRVRSMNVTF